MEYDVVVVNYTDFAANCRVGSKLSNEKHFGTIGGFIQTDKHCMYALLSAHVADQIKNSSHVFISDIPVSPDALCFLTCAEQKQLDTDNATAKYNNYSTDIAAFEIKDVLLRNFKFDCSFQTKDGVTKRCEMPSWGDISVPFSVYLRGASTPLGQGIVTSSDVMPRSGNGYILLEKRDDFSPCCKPGDSGAIICFSDVDDLTIKTLAVVQGGFSIPGSKEPLGYLCVKLDFALDRLSKIYDSKFSLCDDSNM